jgi:transposase InsO family protein
MQGRVILDLVRERRRLMPRLGDKKLYGLLVERRRSNTRTTHSYHHFHKWKNYVSVEPLTARNQVWTSDITYIRTPEGFAYPALIADIYSRKIVGWSLSRSLSIEGAMEALTKALKSNRGDCPLSIVHSPLSVSPHST